MKNVNLTQIYLDLIARCNVTGFTLSSIRKTNSVEPIDAVMDFDCVDINAVNIEDVKEIVNTNISGLVRKYDAKINDNKIHVYIEFIGGDYNDDWAYPTMQ